MSKAVKELEIGLKELFDNDELVGPFLDHIHQEKPRYYRDQLDVIKKLFEEWNKEDILNGIYYCSERELYSAGELKSMVTTYVLKMVGQCETILSNSLAFIMLNVYNLFMLT